jgi:trehalose-phosphatase
VPARVQAGAPSVAYWAGLVSRLQATLRAGRTLLFLCDFDGTLTPIVRDPAEAWLAQPAREDLRVLAASDRLVVGIVSGRRLDDLRLRVGLPSIIYAGCHGLEISGPDMTFSHRVAAGRREALAELARELGCRTAALAGVLVEPKGLAVAVHYRNASPDVLGPLTAALRELLHGRPEYAVLSGRKVYEILPAPDWDKGRGVRWIEDRVQARLGDRVTTVYLGDDEGDERVFAALHGRGITVKVGGATATRAALRVQGVGEVHRVLAALADHVVGGAAR